MPDNVILSHMLDRLYASMLSGPSLNCRPHNSRQRIDIHALERFEHLSPTEILTTLLSDSASVTVNAQVPPPPDLASASADRLRTPSSDDSAEHPEDDAAHRRYRLQRTVLTKLRNLSDDARICEQDTGLAVLNLGYPILSLPPGSLGSGSARVLAPVAFIPLAITVRTGRKPGIDLQCRAEGVERITPNPALIAWLERQSAKSADDLFPDEQGSEPWREIRTLLEFVCRALDLPLSTIDALVDPAHLQLAPIPTADELPRTPVLLPSIVLGLFPSANQSLLRDTRTMIEMPAIDGPVTPFIDASASLHAPAPVPQDAPPDVQPRKRDFNHERLVSQADPSQIRAVQLAGSSQGLVIHGPPGTGKSQTITNIIGDHLARGQRVLFVCDKRSALDVVYQRLKHLQLGSLCAVVHDPQRDQRDLYMSIRAQLEELPDTKTSPAIDRQLANLNREMQRLHDELTAHHDALMQPAGSQPSFHEMVGNWLTLPAAYSSLVANDALASVTDEQWADLRQTVHVALDRGLQAGYSDNPWVACAGLSLDAYLAQPGEIFRQRLASCLEDARAADASRHPAIPPFNTAQSLEHQATFRAQIADQLQQLLDTVPPAVAARAAAWSPDVRRRHLSQLVELDPYLQLLRESPIDAELNLTSKDIKLSLADIARSIGDLDAYLDSLAHWFGFVRMAIRKAGKQLLRQWGLPTTADAASRLRRFFRQLRARIVLTDLLHHMHAAIDDAASQPSPASNPPLLSDAQLIAELDHHRRCIDLLAAVADDPILPPLLDAALSHYDQSASLIDGLRRSQSRATALIQLENSLNAAQLFTPEFLQSAGQLLRAGKAAVESLTRLSARSDSLETILRIAVDLQQLPPGLKKAARNLLLESAEPDPGCAAVERALLACRITHRLTTDPILRQFDGQKLLNSFQRCAELEQQKMHLVQQSITHLWVTRQRERLLAATGSRLNNAGSSLRQRLFVRGQRAMRLRQVIAVGRNHEDGDPLFDLRPVWMASPETVAQIFPLEPRFDVVVFDEASQCRLEEALPVLSRAKRLVIAGDPKQLPPTRFFEAAVTSSDDADLLTDADMFEAQQSEVEDLLAAGLNLEIEEAYLDVHYRSRNADLIEFSNEQFYGSRLQAIPGHPKNRARFSPITLHRISGIYEERCNPLEAREVCRIVHDLLRRASPPSIGIATFNLAQRDLIVEMLDDLAAENDEFAGKLAAARTRQGPGSFEGLFVKNLENVQGDERDHIIISTTYGPNKDGKFYRRFGPLGMAGGGRRLNVLVTRAKQEVHLVSSIPPENYRALPPVPPGTTPNGAWLLFAYLRYAELLAEAYEQNNRILTDQQNRIAPHVEINNIAPFSRLAHGIGLHLCDHHDIASQVHWGNEGFRIDAALHHPARLDDMTLGLLCDFTSFKHTADPVQWDMFRTSVHASQGWQLHRVWSPQLFRDPQRILSAIADHNQQLLAADPPEPADPEPSSEP